MFFKILDKILFSLAHFLFWLLRGADLFLSLDFEFCTLLLSCCALESTTQWRLSAIKVKLELELDITPEGKGQGPFSRALLWKGPPLSIKEGYFTRKQLYSKFFCKKTQVKTIWFYKKEFI